MEYITLFFLFIAAQVCGAITMLGYILWRMMRNEGWDNSNITNALRLLSHVTLHSEDFARMYYLSDAQVKLANDLFPEEVIKRPFWYISEDELSEVVNTRPTGD